MADDPNRYAEVPGGHLFLKPGQVPDQPYTETIAKNRAAKDRELLDSMQATEATVLSTVDGLRIIAESARSEARDAADTVATLGVTVTRTEVGRNYVMDPLFKGNGWTAR